ncbi:trk system potassium uptake protein TrkH [Streptomyces sp. WMMB 714]|uniref:TrkH family potassium uptake protein n=1 Tax=Streptomyces sp. WMMB 714 TaxID=1286822 RepID=UPI000823C17A|nr:TrkH family potassium uptake protein [Streptomyces sp. WMMB 714]SCK09993.1 trk system potassium uptake protein TrkH [Streptomyces sp. WMMB 714]
MTLPRLTPVRRWRPYRRIGVDVRTALGVVGALLTWFAVAFAAPAAVALASGGPPWPFLAAGLGAAAAGLALKRLTGRRPPLGVREGFLVVVAVWLLVPAFGALPFVLGRVPQLRHPVDAYFEAMSGFTATGATVLTDVSALEPAMLFWRQSTQVLGGLGVIVLALAVLPRLRIGGRELLSYELPGGSVEVESLGTTIRDTAQRLWKVYVAVTVLGVLALACLGWSGLDRRMDLAGAFSYGTSAVALGGFAPDAGSARGLAPVTQWVLCGLMAVAGVNLLRLYRLAALRQYRGVARDDELRLYLCLLVVGTSVLAAELVPGGPAEDAPGDVRHAAFQAVSTMTTTGLATVDWSTWGTLATVTLLGLMFVGACAGSASGSIKVVRHLTLFRFARRELEQAVHPDAVIPVRVSGRVVEAPALRSVLLFVVLYVVTLALGTLCVAVDAATGTGGTDAFTALGAAAACLGNVGPAFGEVGPFGSYAPLGPVSKTALTALMLLGRIEIVPLAVLLHRNYWRA